MTKAAMPTCRHSKPAKNEHQSYIIITHTPKKRKLASRTPGQKNLSLVVKLRLILCSSWQTAGLQITEQGWRMKMLLARTVTQETISEK
jgi:hypothetical protein